MSLTGPIVLEGKRVRMEPLEARHWEALCAVGLDPDLWKWIPFPRTTPAEMREYIDEALRHRAAGTAYPFVTIDSATHCIVGSTRYGNIDLVNRRVEIGWTWITKAYQRTHINTEAKFLMFQHAFEKLDCARVELKTDALNEKSRKAILRIGAKEEGTLRSHMTTHSGRRRDTVYFSILAEEWPEVKERLLSRMEGRD